MMKCLKGKAKTISPFRLDVTRVDQWKEIYDHCEKFFGASVDVLVNNAGIASANSTLVIDVNLLGVVHGSTEFLSRYGKSKVRHVIQKLN